jgi:hypothetical protein
MSKIEKIITEALTHFESKKRHGTDDEIILLKISAPEALRDSVREAHGNRLPDDWIYQKYHDLLAAFSERDIKSLDDFEETRTEIVDGHVDIYTSDLTAWLNGHNTNVYYLTEVLEEGGVTDGFRLLMQAQYKAIDEIASEVVDYITAQ